MLVLKRQLVNLLGRIVNISLLKEKAVLRKNVFTMEGPGKGNGFPCSSVQDREQDEVTNLKDFNMYVGSQYIEKVVAITRKGVILLLRIRERC
jgi:hypothetical protein